MFNLIRNISNKCHLDIVSEVQQRNLLKLYENYQQTGITYKQVILVRKEIWSLVGGLGLLGADTHWYMNDEVHKNSLGSDTCPVVDGRFIDYCNPALRFDTELEYLEKLRIFRENNEAT